MSKVSESILKGAQEALLYARGQKKGARQHKVEVPNVVDVLAIRKKLHMSRTQFANHYGFNVRTLEKWEQGKRKPDSAVRAYLMVINKNPKAVESALHAA